MNYKAVHNQKDTAKILKKHNEERKFGELKTHGHTESKKSSKKQWVTYVTRLSEWMAEQRRQNRNRKWAKVT